MDNTQLKKKRFLQKYWYALPIVAVMLLVGSIPIYAVITGFSVTSVGQTIFNYYLVGSGTFAMYSAGGYSTNQMSNSIAQSIYPVIAVAMILLIALKSYLLENGLVGLIKTLLLIVVGSVMLGAIVVILSQLT